jgi:tetratricopeptide (TPR) repeat protein
MTDRDQFRRRVLASAALWLLFAALLSALSFFLLAVVLTAILALGAGVAFALWGLRNYGGTALEWTGEHVITVKERAPELHVQERSRLVGRRARQGGRRVGRRAGKAGRLLGDRARSAAAATPGRSRTLAVRTMQLYAAAVYRSRVTLVRRFETTGRRRALRLNARGTELRRSGNPEQAAAQHRVALAIVRDLGDQQAEAMTLNNLALALAQDGAEDAALVHLEQALTVLRELGDEEHEGQVIANLGFVHGRQGHQEEAVHLLHEALDMLPPESLASRLVEEQRLRAS